MKYKSVILAAGDGTRMKSQKSKVLHEAAGLPLLAWVLRAVDTMDTEENVVVCGRAVDEIKERFGDRVSYAEQAERKGSGHAVMCAREYLRGFDGYTLIVAGDMPLLRGVTVKDMAAYAVEKEYDCILLSAELRESYGYGRVIRDENTGDVTAIVEEKDATDSQREIKEVNASCYCVKNSVLLGCLDQIKPQNAQGEYYITDIVGIINDGGGRVGAYTAADHTECMGVNDRIQLAAAAALLRNRINMAHMKNGVTLVDPSAVYIDPDTVIGADTVIHPGVTLEAGCKVGADVVLHPGSRISNSIIGDRTAVQNSVVLHTQIGEGCTIGPNAYLRPGTVIGNHCRVGDFVEVKNATVGDGTKVSHLTYIGDADLGENINVGCGVVFVNYDGKQKYRSKIGDDVFIGCNTNLISPVEVGGGTYIAAGTTVTEDVSGDSFVIGRARQTVKHGWKDKRK